jgi:protocatechuate 3,4-dioxygenase beta subunit
MRMSPPHEDGRILTRREAIVLLGAASLGAALASREATAADPANASCVLSPALEKSPSFVDERLNRSDLTANSTNPLVTTGVPLTLAVTVLKATGTGCIPLRGAQVDIWQADAGGKYSDRASEGTAGETYLRGYQITDANGLATFKLVYPGWYRGRAVHTHAMIRLFSSSGCRYKYETQLFYDPAITATVMALAPYNRRGHPDTMNGTDREYAQSRGRTLVSLTRAAGSGYDGKITLAVRI